jgi:hypothetical protein
MSQRINTDPNYRPSGDNYALWFVIFLSSFFLTFLSVAKGFKLPSLIGVFVTSFSGYAAGHKNCAAFFNSNSSTKGK